MKAAFFYFFLGDQLLLLLPLYFSLSDAKTHHQDYLLNGEICLASQSHQLIITQISSSGCSLFDPITLCPLCPSFSVYISWLTAVSNVAWWDNMGINTKVLGFEISLLLTIFAVLGASAADDYLELVTDQGLMSELEEEPWTMVGKCRNQFILNGRPFYFNGFNTYWLMVFAADQSTRAKVSDVFKQASSVGLSVCRTWAFNDGQYRALQKSPGVYDEDVFKGLDFVVSEAKKNKIRLILSLVNNWNDYGGKAQYVKWGKDAGLNVTAEDDFFSDPTRKTYYKNHVKTVLNRVNTFTNVTYKDDPTIFSWELMNEPRCTSDPSGNKLQAWIGEMAAYVKSIDPKHLLEIGVEGFYGPSTPNRAQFNPNTYATQVGTDFIRNHQVLGVDFASVHIYADSWISSTISDAHLQFYNSWMQAHIDDADKTLGMPVVFAEFGVSTKDKGYNSSFRDTTYKLVYKTLVESAKKGGSGAGSLMWQLFPEGTDYMNDGYAVVLSKASSIADIISLNSARFELINMACAWHCRWGCKKRLLAVDKSLSQSEL